MRERYATMLAQRLAPGTRVLLITLTYDQSEMDGPPFSVPDGEIRSLFADSFEIDEKSTKDVLSGNDGLRKRGVTSLTESVYLLTRKTAA